MWLNEGSIAYNRVKDAIIWSKTRVYNRRGERFVGLLVVASLDAATAVHPRWLRRGTWARSDAREVAARALREHGVTSFSYVMNSPDLVVEVSRATWDALPITDAEARVEAGNAVASTS